VVDGTPLLAFGVVSPNRNRYYSNDPWFKGEWYQSRDEAEKARQGIVEKLAEMRKQARELREAEQLKAEAESARQELQGLYSHEGWNSLNWNFREEVDRQHYSSLPSSTQEIRKWIVQTKALCAKVEATIAENIRARQEEARQKAEVERAEREELAVVLQWTGDNLETAREIRAFAQAIAEIKGASEGAKILRQELNAPYGRARRQGNISYLVRGLSDTDAGQRFLSLYRASDEYAWIAGAAAWLESKLEKSDNKSQAKPVELSTVTTLFGVAVQQSSKRRKK
jgi:hypothetical protein